MPTAETAPAVAVIPARLASTRFPGKMLASQTGKPLIQHVWERARLAPSLSRVVVATDDALIRDALKPCGAEVIMTRVDHPNGTSRLAEAAAAMGLSPDTLVVNVQGDEPEMDVGAIEAAVAAARATGAAVTTVASPFGEGEDPANPNIVKVVVGVRGNALYFSRARIPFDRDARGVSCLRHVGLYVYRASFLQTYITLAPTPLEQAEMLEQLRVLEHGHAIAVAQYPCSSPGIDTSEQYAAFVARWKASAARG